MWGHIISFCLGASVTRLFYKNIEKAKENTALYRLKNALLSYALTTVFDDMIGDPFVFNIYDGTKLPPLTDSYFDYIVSPSLVQSKHEEEKQDAISRFIYCNIPDDECVHTFMDLFIDIHDPIEQIKYM